MGPPGERLDQCDQPMTQAIGLCLAAEFSSNRTADDNSSSLAKKMIRDRPSEADHIQRPTSALG